MYCSLAMAVTLDAFFGLIALFMWCEVVQLRDRLKSGEKTERTLRQWLVDRDAEILRSRNVETESSDRLKRVTEALLE